MPVKANSSFACSRWCCYPALKILLSPKNDIWFLNWTRIANRISGMRALDFFFVTDLHIAMHLALHAEHGFLHSVLKANGFLSGTFNESSFTEHWQLTVAIKEDGK